MNTEDFVTYEQAAALKKLGFREKCLYHYNIFNEFEPNRFKAEDEIINVDDLYISLNTNALSDIVCDAPTLAQAQKWLREEKELWVFSNRINQKELKGKFYWSIYDKDLNEFDSQSFKLFNFYEESLSAGITECLNLLK